MLGNYVEVELHELPNLGERVVEKESKVEGGFCWLGLGVDDIAVVDDKTGWHIEVRIEVVGSCRGYICSAELLHMYQSNF